MVFNFEFLAKIVSVFFFSLFFGTNVIAQVTIGKSEAPVGGALLQLSDLDTNPATGVNASKGLGLPRIYLTSLNDITTGDISGVTDANKDDHIGLLVYNTNVCLNGLYSAEGIYVWTGDEWDALHKTAVVDQTAYDSNSEMLTDYEGNRYTTKVFGDYRWMTQNLRTTRKFDGTYIDCENGVRMLDPTLESNKVGITIKDKIPSGPNMRYIVMNADQSGRTTVEMTREAYANKFGFLYTWEQTLIACPKGWRHPGQVEWDDLYKATDPSNASVTWNNTSNGRPFFSVKNLKADNKIYLAEWETETSSTLTPWGGLEPTDPNNSGFNAFPVGALRDDNITSQGFGQQIAFWYSDRGSRYASLMRSYDSDTYHIWLTSPKWNNVRCVQDK